MEEKHNLEQTAEHLKQYAETRWNLIQLEVSDKVSSVVSSLASIALIGVLFIFILLFSSIGIAWWIGQQTDSASMGFFILAGFYLVVALIIYGIRNPYRCTIDPPRYGDIVDDNGHITFHLTGHSYRIK